MAAASPAANSSSGIPSPLPSLVVFDLDQCTWSPEMFQLSTPPIPGKGHGNEIGPLDSGLEGAREELGVTGARAGPNGPLVRLFPGALRAFQQLWRGDLDSEKQGQETVRFAAASSADTPLAARIARATMLVLEVFPGITVRDVFSRGWSSEEYGAEFDGNLQIGRSPPLSGDKARSHFPELHRATGVPYSEMLFFDDCNWGDHVGKVQYCCDGTVVLLFAWTDWNIWSVCVEGPRASWRVGRAHAGRAASGGMGARSGALRKGAAVETGVSHQKSGADYSGQKQTQQKAGAAALVVSKNKTPTVSV
jgi:magnesium-dependent phosphatase 1